MHIPFKLLSSSSSATGLWTPPGFMLICTSESSVLYVRSLCLYAFTVQKKQNSHKSKWKDTTRQILHCMTNSRVQRVRLQVDFILSQIAYLQNTVSLMLLFYGYFVYSQKAFILEVQLKL